MLNTERNINLFFHSDTSCVEFALECRLEDRIDFVRRRLSPWLTQPRLWFNFSVAKIAELIPLSSLKILIYRALGVRIGRGVFISPDVMLDPHFPRLITLEDYSVLGWGSKIFTHEMSTKKYRIGRVTIGRGAVIGAYSVIRSGVSVGPMAQTAMNSFIYCDVPAEHSGKPQERTTSL